MARGAPRGVIVSETPLPVPLLGPSDAAGARARR